MGNDINALKTLLLKLQNDILELKNQTGNRNVDYNFEDVIQEMQDRESRKTNIIVFGIKEQSSDLSKADRSAAEESEVMEILKVIEPGTDLVNIPMHRLGRFDANRARPRPLKITMENEKYVHSYIKNCKKLKDNDKYKNISLSFDRTPRQISHYNKLKEEVTRRKQNNEQITIRYIRGIPKIVPLN